MVVQVSTMSSKTGFRLSPKNWPVYYQPSGVQAPGSSASPLPSSRGLGHGPLKAGTRVRIPQGAP
jgi:hypothetical protein